MEIPPGSLALNRRNFLLFSFFFFFFFFFFSRDAIGTPAIDQKIRQNWQQKKRKSNRHRLVFPFKSQPSVGAVDLVDCLDQSKSPSLDHVTWSRFTRSFILMPPFITIIIIIIIIFRRQQKSTLSRPPEGKTKPDSGETKDEHGRQRQKEPAGAERPKEKKKKGRPFHFRR